MNRKNNKPQATLFLHYSSYSEGGNVCEGEENEEWPSYEDEQIYTDFENLSRKSNGRVCSKWIEVDEELSKAEILHLVIVKYRDGGTFKSTSGNWEVMLTTDNLKEAEEMAASINDGSFKKKYPKSYAPWEGYFAGLEGVEVHTFNVSDESPSSKGFKYCKH
jgi:hypothetical protein